MFRKWLHRVWNGIKKHAGAIVGGILVVAGAVTSIAGGAGAGLMVAGAGMIAADIAKNAQNKTVAGLARVTSVAIDAKQGAANGTPLQIVNNKVAGVPGGPTVAGLVRKAA